MDLREVCKLCEIKMAGTGSSSCRMVDFFEAVLHPLVLQSKMSFSVLTYDIQLK